MGTDLVRAGNGQIQTVGFGQTEVKPYSETSSSATAARETAMIQARCIMAMQRPRDTERFRVELLKECRRPGFAEVAEYERPVGKEFNDDTGKWEQKIARGPSVHLIRTAIALYTNIMADALPLFESPTERVVQAYVLDLERNVSWARSIIISKVVERKGQKGRHGESEPPKGRTVISQRENSYGEITYTVFATDDEVRNKEANLLAKAQRENGRAVLPRDIIDSAILVARETMQKKDAEDPDAAKRKLIDAFAELSVSPSDVSIFLGHGLDRISPAEIKELRGVFVSLREGHATWDEILEAKNPTGSAEASEKVAEKKLSSMRGAQPDAKTAETKATETKPETAIDDTTEYINEDQHLTLLTAANDSGWSQADITANLKQAGIDNANKIPAARFQAILEVIRSTPKEKEEKPAASPRRRL
jgi:hypothetical protein